MKRIIRINISKKAFVYGKVFFYKSGYHCASRFPSLSRLQKGYASVPQLKILLFSRKRKPSEPLFSMCDSYEVSFASFYRLYLYTLHLGK